MEWYIFALMAALFQAIHNGFIKKYVRRLHIYHLAGGTLIIAGLILTLASVYRGIPTTDSTFWLVMVATIITYSLATYFYYKALDISDISLVVPMISFTPMFMLLSSYVLLQEFPSMKGLGGIILIVFGSYLLHFTNFKHWIKPFKALYERRGVRYMLLVAFIYSITASLEKIMILRADPYFTGGIEKLAVGALFLGLMHNHESGLAKKENGLFTKVIIATGVLSGLTTLTQNIAMTLTLAPYVVAIKRMVILFSVLIGYFFFKEKHMRQRFLGSVVMIIGVLLILS